MGFEVSPFHFTFRGRMSLQVVVRASLSRTISQAVIFSKTHVLSPLISIFAQSFNIVQMLIKQWFTNHQS